RAGELAHHCGDGHEHLRAVARFMSGWAAAMEGSDPLLLVQLRQAFDEVVSVPDPMVTSRYSSMLADACLHLGQRAAAAAALDRADAERGESRFYDAQLHRQRAALALCRAGGRRVTESVRREVETALETAIVIATEQGSVLLVLRAMV